MIITTDGSVLIVPNEREVSMHLAVRDWIMYKDEQYIVLDRLFEIGKKDIEVRVIVEERSKFEVRMKKAMQTEGVTKEQTEGITTENKTDKVDNKSTVDNTTVGTSTTEATNMVYRPKGKLEKVKG